MCGNVDSAVLLCSGQTKHMVILVDSTTDCTKAVVAVCEYVRYGELLKSACSCGKQDSHVCNIV